MVPAVDLPPPSPVQVVQCVTQAAIRYQLPPEIILAVMRTEGGRVGGVQKNTNGTVDIGPMQINSVHMGSTFSGYLHPKRVRDDVCVNIHAGAYLLKKAMIESGGFWTGVSRYHSRTPSLGEAYRDRVYRQIPAVEHEIRTNPLWRAYVQR